MGKSMKNWTKVFFLTVSMVAFILVSCEPMAKVTPMETAIPTLTIKLASPTPANTPTPPPLPTHYQVPIWLADPNYAVFAMVTDVSDNSMVFLVLDVIFGVNRPVRSFELMVVT
jgi:hypothetical protein